MVRLEDQQSWHRAPAARGGGHHEDLIRVDAAGRPQGLQISPASAFKRPHVEKTILETACPPPLTKLVLNSEVVGDSVCLHKYLQASNWKALWAALEQLREKDDAGQMSCALSEENDHQETTLHTAAWKCPTNITLRMLELTPPDQRKALLLRRDDVGNTVLHLCCANVDERVEFTVTKNVLLLAPEALEMLNAYGDTPLHLLVCSPGFKRSNDFTVEIAAEEAVTSLLSLVKEQGTMQNNMGLTLLHCAIAHGAHERVLVQLLNIAPEAASVPDIRGMLPLHYAAAFGGTPWTFVQKLIDAYPAALLAPSQDGDTPLHLLVVNAEMQLNDAGLLDRNTIKIAELLLSTPHSQKCALFMPNNGNLCPLHCCAIFECPPQLTRILMVSEHAGAASVIPTHSGWTALHLACVSSSGNKPTENVEALTTQRACRVFDENDRTPLMLALEADSVSVQLVKFLTQRSPKSTGILTKKGRNLPLHIALDRNVKASVIKHLVNANPASLLMRNSNGDTALHIACRNGGPISTVKLLLIKGKEARRIKNKNNEYPLDLARWHGLNADVPELNDSIIDKERSLEASSTGSGTLSSAEEVQNEFVVSFH